MSQQQLSSSVDGSRRSSDVKALDENGGANDESAMMPPSPFSSSDTTSTSSTSTRPSQSASATAETTATTTPASKQSKQGAGGGVIHYLFLVHGWMGNDTEMSYLDGAIQRVLDDNAGGSGDDDDDESVIVVHRTRCNNQKTSDGIVSGGKRLVDEIIEFIRADLTTRRHRRAEEEEDGEDDEKKDDETQSDTPPQEHRQQQQNRSVTISFVGNSLGGLYARYAIAELPSTLSVIDNEEEEESIDLIPNVFCTTATPHLGVASHTYLPIPRFAEHIIGTGIGQTGKDLFRLGPSSSSNSNTETTPPDSDNDNENVEEEKSKDLIYTMSTTSKFLQPLRQFQKRIAYANAFGTDFQVPTDTAAFLCGESTYPHWHIQEEEEVKVRETTRKARRRSKRDKNGTIDSFEGISGNPNAAGGEEKKEEGDEDDLSSFIVMTLRTDRTEEVKWENWISNTGGQQGDSEEESKDILHMSQSLDSVGWTKVFVDVRDGIPVPSLPMPFSKKGTREAVESFLKERHLQSSIMAAAKDVDPPTEQQNDTTTNTTTTASYSTSFPSSSSPSSICNNVLGKKSQIRIESRELVPLLNPSDRLHFPLGHTVMVANSKNQLYTKLNAKGRPVMEKLAVELVEEIRKLL